MSAQAAGTGALARVAARVRSLGFGVALRKAISDHVYRRSSSVIVEYRWGWTDLNRPFTAPAGYTFSVIEPGEALPPLGAWLAPRRAAFERMLAAGKTAVFVSDANAAIGCVWLAFSDHHDRDARERYSVPEGEAYHYCWLVDPSYRRSPASLALCRFLLRHLHGRGIVRQFGVVDRVNRASYKVQLHFGYRECGLEVIHIYLLHRRMTWTRAYTGTLGLLPGADGN